MNKYYYKGMIGEDVATGIIIRINETQACSALEEAGITITSMTPIPDGQHVYLYTGFDANGQEVDGEVVTESSGSVNKSLKAKGVFPTSIKAVEEKLRLTTNDNPKADKSDTEKSKGFTISFAIFGFRFSFTIERV